MAWPLPTRSSSTQKIHEASTLHPPAPSPDGDGHAMIRTTYSKLQIMRRIPGWFFCSRRFAWGPHVHGVKHKGRGSFPGFHFITS